MAGSTNQEFRPELRKDPINNRLVLIADREGRPSGKLREDYRPPEACPFCPGREDRTPPAVLVLPDGATGVDGDWQVRVIPNLFPAVVTEAGLAYSGMWLFDQATGYGYHEVVVESPGHFDMLWCMPREQVMMILEAWGRRLDVMRQDPRIRYVTVFRNYRLTAGGSILHPHSQIIAIPVTPPVVASKLRYAREFYAAHTRCVFCDLIASERRDGSRLIFENDHFIALAPYASRVPFEMVIYPLRHQHDLLDMTEEEKWALVDILQEVLGRLYTYLGGYDEDVGAHLNAPYNVVLNTAPSTHPRPGHPDYWGTIEADFHWHIEILPRVTRLAGFEWGSGIIINPMLPERAAAILRETPKPACLSPTPAPSSQAAEVE